MVKYGKVWLENESMVRSMERNNPFTIAFGREPISLIKREKQLEEIKTSFLNDNPLTYAYVITGIRGSGKTVLLTSTCQEFSKMDDWIVVELNPDRNMLESFAAKLYENSHLKYKFLKKELSFSFQGLTFSIKGENPVYDVENLLEKMLKVLKKHNKKVLVAIDEVSNNKEVRTFIHPFQILNRGNLPIFLLMTGLFENVSRLENDKSLTFLYRAPKIDLDPLDLFLIKNSYMKELNVNEETAIELAKLTKGYAFGYQSLGYLAFNSGGIINDDLLRKYDEYLKTFVYDKVWSELSNVDHKILEKLATNESGDVEYIYKELNMKKSTFSPYRDKLIKNGVIISKGWGFIDFALPRFREYIDILKQFE